MRLLLQNRDISLNEEAKEGKQYLSCIILTGFMFVYFYLYTVFIYLLTKQMVTINSINLLIYNVLKKILSVMFKGIFDIHSLITLRAVIFLHIYWF